MSLIPHIAKNMESIELPPLKNPKAIAEAPPPIKKTNFSQLVNQPI
jgi:hypothetical protein